MMSDPKFLTNINNQFRRLLVAKDIHTVNANAQSIEFDLALVCI